jgi:hypothetical protein
LTPTISTQTISTPGQETYTTPTNAGFLAANWTITTLFSTLYSQNVCYVTASNTTNSSTTDQRFRLTFTFTPNSVGSSNGYTAQSYTLTVAQGAIVGPASTNSTAKAFFFINPTYYNAPTLTNVQAITTTSGGTTTYDIYSTSSVDLSPVWRLNESASGINVIRLSATQSSYYNTSPFIQSGSYPGMESPVFPFTLQTNDMIRLFNYTSSQFTRNDEYRVVNVFTETSGSDVFPYINVTVDRVISPANYTASYNIPRYIVLKHIPDETNLILEFNSTYNIPTDGLIFPQYIDPVVRANSGNVIKALKQQNLI